MQTDTQFDTAMLASRPDIWPDWVLDEILKDVLAVDTIDDMERRIRTFIDDNGECM